MASSNKQPKSGIEKSIYKVLIGYFSQEPGTQ